MKKQLFCLFALLSAGCLSWPGKGHAQPSGIFVYTDDTSLKPLRKGLFYLEDVQNTHTAEQVVASARFSVNTQDVVPNFGSSGSTFWIVFRVRNASRSEHLLLKLAQPMLEDVTFHRLKDGAVHAEKTGIRYPFRQRGYDNQHFLFDLKLAKGETGTYLLRLSTTGPLQVPLLVGSAKAVQQSLGNENMYMGLYAGVVLAMLLYNAFLLFTINSRSYGYYVLNIFVVGITQATFQGYTYKFLWPASPWLALHAAALSASLAAITSMAFIRVFLRLSKTSPRLDKIMKAFMLGFVPAMVLSVAGFEDAAYEIVRVAALLSSVYCLFVSYTVYRRGSRTAGFLLLAWTIFLVGICIFVLKDMGLLPYNDFTNNTMLIGSAAELVLLSFALADRINKLKKEKERTQKKMLETLQANEKLMQEDNLKLETKVRERTRALEEAAEELQATLNNLKDAQAQLFQAEKMASIGQLTAGIAHEINNPINFVSASVKPLRRDVNQLWQLLDTYEATVKGLEGEWQTLELETLKRRLDVDYLKEEIDLLLRGVEDGASRTASIVLGLRNFSRLDDEELRPVDLHEGLDSTLLLLNHSLKDNVQVQKAYGSLPEVACYPGKLNQVFMNILTNALQAMKARPQGAGPGLLTVKTESADGYACISIRDNGIGMSEQTRSRIFDPFFTTKTVGEGTGLGLSIVFGIIKAHQGILDVHSIEGVGSEFIIRIPFKCITQRQAAGERHCSVLQ